MALLKLSVIKSNDGVDLQGGALVNANAKLRFINVASIIDAFPTATNGAFVRYNDPTSIDAKEVTVLEAASSF